MKTFLKNIIIAGLSTSILSLSMALPAYADTYRLKIYNIEAYDDGDNDPDGEGEITFSFTVNGDNIFKEYMELDDKTAARNYPLEIVKTVTVGNGGNVKITARGHEKDSWLGDDETCRGSTLVDKNNLGDLRLDCGENNGDLGIWLDFHAEKVN